MYSKHLDERRSIFKKEEDLLVVIKCQMFFKKEKKIYLMEETERFLVFCVREGNCFL